MVTGGGSSLFMQQLAVRVMKHGLGTYCLICRLGSARKSEGTTNCAVVGGLAIGSWLRR
jgi:hypothetical protein